MTHDHHVTDNQSCLMQEDLLRSFEEEQLLMYTQTPVWEMRDKPPDEWDNSDSGSFRDSGGSESSDR